MFDRVTRARLQDEAVIQEARDALWNQDDWIAYAAIKQANPDLASHLEALCMRYLNTYPRIGYTVTGRKRDAESKA